jgi:Uncharacterized conserved protein (DUF2075)
MKRAYYAAPVELFLASNVDQVLGRLTAASEFSVDLTQRDAWQQEITVLRQALMPYVGRGRVYLEFVVPRLGKRIDAVLLIDHVILVVEFKVGETSFGRQDIDQVWDYALDLKNFHESSHAALIAPILVVTGVKGKKQRGGSRSGRDGVAEPALVSAERLHEVVAEVLGTGTLEHIEPNQWEQGRYRPTPTIVEAAAALYRGHAVEDISRSDAGATNLAQTAAAVSQIIEASRERRVKSICLVTGVPGAGKTLVGLDIATRYLDPQSDLHSVYLSGNGPLVSILREALARDDVQRAKARGETRTKGDARQAVKAFIQPIHHFRDECLKDPSPPPEHVTIFDEAQRAWNLEKTADFMSRKKGQPGFAMSEPAFLISCLDRHPDWAVVVCLIGGGQEINTGEAGIGEWIRAIQASYPHWEIHVSPKLSDAEYAAESELKDLQSRAGVSFEPALHLSTSMRAFRAESVSTFVKKVLDLEVQEALGLHASFADRYPVVLTRNVDRARKWLREQARGSERYGIVVSSQAQRLKPHAIDVRTPMDPVNWFLNDRDDVRSSYYLEDVATEFHVQGLELDWSCVVWDADFRHGGGAWQHHSFVGNRWQRIRKDERRAYLKNAYRVLLTRARQGMVIVVPEGSLEDATRQPAFYDGTFAYLKQMGLPVLT